MEYSQRPLNQKIEKLADLGIDILNSKQDLENSYSEYEKFLDWTLEKQIDEYKIFSLTIYDSQLSVIKNYLWLAAMLIGADCSLLAYMNFSLSNLSEVQAIFGSFTVLSGVLSLNVFIKGTKLLLGEKGGVVPNITDSHLKNLKLAYGSDADHKIFVVKNKMSAQLQYSIDYLRDGVSSKALKIRSLNNNLVLSAVLVSNSALFYYLFR